MSTSQALPARSVVLSTQLIFNIGFYAVVPFIAVYMRDELEMGSALIGLVLGVRTFSQQGMFAVGGWLAHHFGYRWLMLLGCVVRVLGYGGLAIADTATGLVVSAALTGIGGALFSPCLEAMTAALDRQEQQSGQGSRKASMFATFAVFGEFGAVAGPLLGGWLMQWGFTWMALACAGLFMAMAGVLYVHIPHTIGRPDQLTWRWVMLLKNPAFLLFCAAYSSYLFSYNQLYMALPAALDRIHAPTTMLSWLFVLASVLIITLQLPLARWCRQWPARHVLVIGFLLMAAAFGCLALGGNGRTGGEVSLYGGMIPIVGFVVLLCLGQMFAVPVAMSLVPRFAAGNALPVYYGVLASAGGITVLLGNVLLGLAQDWQASRLAGGDVAHGVDVVWLMAMSLPVISALCFSRLRLPTA